ncbi:MAG: holo-[acyl-carrier-protein] synthase [Planctomycetota bacterium]|nr:MAG: holo-[acyl-carrier-protein] synthase [Planctomycetota bacterium]
MMHGLGTDIIEVARVRAVYQRHGKRFLDRIYTAAEQDYCLQQHDPGQRLAARWAAKEAFFKALGSGIIGKVRMSDVEIYHDNAGAPHLRPHNLAQEWLQQRGTLTCWLSMSHCQNYATATVVLTDSPP